MPHLIAVANVKAMPMPKERMGTLDDIYSNLLWKVVKEPNVMISSENVYWNACIVEFS